MDETGWLVEEIQKDPESAVVAAFLNWKWVPSGAERAQWDIAELELNSKRPKGRQPVRLDRPWQGKKRGPEPAMVPVDDPERLAAIARLKSLS